VADKNLSKQIGSNSASEVFWGNFFSLTVGQQRTPQQTWHIPTAEIGRNKTGTLKRLK